MDLTPRILGERLHAVRELLSQDTQTSWTLARVAKAARLSEKKVRLLEEGKADLIVCLQLLVFYADLGYNPNWVVCEWNAEVPRRCKPKKEWTEEDYKAAREQDKALQSYVEQTLYPDKTSWLSPFLSALKRRMLAWLRG